MKDLAGPLSPASGRLHYWGRIHQVACNYLSREQMQERYQDLATQYQEPHTRSWDKVAWDQISDDQIVGVECSTFLAMVRAAAEVEAPVDAYGSESWGYIHDLDPEFSRFVSGQRGPDGERVKDEHGRRKGVWEEEEWGHSAHFKKIYTQLTGEKPADFVANSVAEVQRNPDPREAAKRHLQMRIAAEVSACAGYSWMMAHSTGQLQAAVAQPFQDELGHLSKFWGFYREAFPEENPLSALGGTTKALLQLAGHNQGERSVSQEIRDDRVGLGLAFAQVLASAAHWDLSRGPHQVQKQS